MLAAKYATQLQCTTREFPQKSLHYDHQGRRKVVNSGGLSSQQENFSMVKKLNPMEYS